MTGEGTLEFRLLGPLEARVENRLLPLGGVGSADFWHSCCCAPTRSSLATG